jgi:beta-glucosidase
MKKSALTAVFFSALFLFVNCQTDPIEQKVSSVMKDLTVEEKIDLLCAKAPAIERHSMPAYDWWSECLHGVARAGKATVFPKPIALGSMWDTELLNEIAVAISDEARAKYHAALAEKGYTNRYEGLTFFSPTLNIARDPRWGRTSECFSEDPLLTSQMGVAFIQGLQSEKEGHLKLVATSKHFVANNEENRRNDGSADVDELSLREYYLPAFEASVKEGKVASFMSAYNALNGVPCTANSFLLDDVLRKEWGFDGVTISDGSAVEKIYTHHKYKSNLAEASAAALLAGCNMSLRDEYRQGLRDAYAQKLIQEKDLDEAVKHVLELRVRLGMFDSFASPYADIPMSIVECEKHRQLAQEAAEKSIILLKNNGILPIKYENKRIALIGNAFNKVYYGDYSGIPDYNPTLFEVIKNEIGDKAEVKWVSDFAEEEEVIPSNCFLREAKYEYEGRLGLTGEYFNNPNLEGEAQFKQHDLTLDISTDRKEFATNTTGISAKWHSSLVAPETGLYKLHFKGSANWKLYLNGKLVADTQVKHGEKSVVNVQLEAKKENQLIIEARGMQKNVHYSLCWETPRNKQIASPEKVAASADLAIVFMRDDRASEGKDRTTLAMTEHQQSFIEKIIKANPNTIVIIGASAPLLLKEVAEKSAALLNIWIGGQGEAPALANILLGKANPSGKTPVTFVSNEQELPALDDYNIKNGRSYQYFKGEVLFPFGYGLSYTTFDYGKPSIKNQKITSKECLTASISITNTGDMDGEEIIQYYVSSPVWNDLHRKLVAFKRVSIPKGQTVEVSLDIPASRLRRWSESQKTWQIISGEYELHVVPNSQASNSCSFQIQ